ncbi:MAG: CotH kinase family protein [Lachnospiraceae bacterium]|nr:CotH kinase family protein [Lachnospiraceae bacterium]
MSTSKHLTAITAIVMAVAILLTLFAMNSASAQYGNSPRSATGGSEGSALIDSSFSGNPISGTSTSSTQATGATGRYPLTSLGYEDRLFDLNRVHTIDIAMPDFDNWIQSATDEAYTAAIVTIDGETVPNVGFRVKGNGSLMAVTMMNSPRFSFKIEFDHFQDRQTYHGLDKLCLNNLVEDATYMKDLLVYESMREMGVPAPLVSYTFLTVNGEDFGLYMAVEGIEDSFLSRYYGQNDCGKLYKPDSTNITEFGFGPNMNIFALIGWVLDNIDLSALAEMDFSQYEGMSMDDIGTGSAGSFDFEDSFGDGSSFFSGSDDMSMSMFSSLFSKSEDMTLTYLGETPSSYPSIMKKAKSPVTYQDQMRLIAALKRLSAREDLAHTVDIDEVIRYFAVHNLFVNADSYTGMSTRNYYLYERNGVLSMLPWDYNLAYGTLMMKAEYAVNDPIDEPMAVRSDGKHPMFEWITADDTYQAQYYAYMTEALDRMDFAALIDETAALITPYIERDPTKFVSMEQFTAGYTMLKEYMARRTLSVRGQLSGTVPSTKEGQLARPEALISHEGIDLHAMGDVTMGIADERQDLSGLMGSMDLGILEPLLGGFMGQ